MFFDSSSSLNFLKEATSSGYFVFRKSSFSLSYDTFNAFWREYNKCAGCVGSVFNIGFVLTRKLITIFIKLNISTMEKRKQNDLTRMMMFLPIPLAPAPALAFSVICLLFILYIEYVTTNNRRNTVTANRLYSPLLPLLLFLK